MLGLLQNQVLQSSIVMSVWNWILDWKLGLLLTSYVGIRMIRRWAGEHQAMHGRAASRYKVHAKGLATNQVKVGNKIAKL